MKWQLFSVKGIMFTQKIPKGIISSLSNKKTVMQMHKVQE